VPPEVTAVITTHARPHHVCEALLSVRAETHHDVEIIVVDDGGQFTSCPGVPDAAVHLVRSESLGIGRARNLGLATARGEFVIYLDDDDVALPHRIASLLRAARSSGAALCFGRTRRVAAGTDARFDDIPTHVPMGGRVTFADVLTCNPHVNSVLARTEALRAVGGFDEAASHFDDWSAWLRIADRDLVWSIADVVADWRIHPHGLSARLLTIRAMESRLVALFDRLEPALSRRNARAVSMARRAVLASEIRSYDDYVTTMMELRTRKLLRPGSAPLDTR
jgi:glycosyltransferase involved in cell wall biosynthesis